MTEAWSLSLSPHLESPWLLTVLGALLITLLLGYRSTVGLKPGRRWALLALSALGLAGAALTLAGIERRKERRRPVPGRALIVIDRSASMDDPERHALIQATVNEATVSALKKNLRVSLIGLGERASALTLDQLNSPGEEQETRLIDSLEVARRRFKGERLAGLTLITDAVDRSGDLDDEQGRARFSERLKKLDVPVHVLIAPSDASPDLTLEMVSAPPLAFVRNTTPLKVRLRGRGFPGVRPQLRLRGPGVDELVSELPPQNAEFEEVIEVAYKPARVGRQVIELTVTGAQGERRLDNNRLLLPIKVVRDRLRVLQVAGEPTWDVRFLRRLLKEDPGVDLVSFFILRTREDDLDVAEDEMSLIPFPERELFEEQLHTFDVVIFQDFNFAPYSVGRYLRHIRRFVEEDGGGFVMVGGPRSFSEGEYKDTPIAELLPTQIGDAPADPRFFKPIVTAAAHPILDLSPSESAQQLIDKLPLLAGRNRLGTAKPGATVLLKHEEGEVVMAARAFGAGRALAIAADSLWNWQLPAAERGGGLRPYYRLWHNILRWLSGDPSLSRLQWTEVPERIAEGATATMSLTLRDPEWRGLAQAEVSVTLRHRSGERRRLEGITDERGVVRLKSSP